MKRIAINFSTSKYWLGQDRLAKTIKNKSEFLSFRNESEINCHLHSEMMYGFKPASFLKAKELGYSTVLWLDASMYVLKDLSPLFDHIEKYGYFFQDSGWYNKDWTSLSATEYFGTDKGKMISAGVIGLDLNNQEAIEFLTLWNKSMLDGMFNGSHENYRHDQTAASLIIQNMGLAITPNNTFWQYGLPEDKTIHDNILIIANGIV